MKHWDSFLSGKNALCLETCFVGIPDKLGQRFIFQILTILTLFLFKQKIDDFCVRPWNEILHHHMNVLKFEKYSENFLTTILLTAHFLGYYNFKIAILENFAHKGHSWRKIKIDKSANSVDVRSIVNIFMVFCFLRNDEKWKRMPLAKIIFINRIHHNSKYNLKMILAQEH